MTTTMPEVAKTVTTGNSEIDKKMGGGVPVGSLSLIEGQSDAGKSVLSQHLASGALSSDVGVAYYTTENTVKSLIGQMASLSLEVTDYFLVDRLRIYPIQIASGGGLEPEVAFARIARHIASLPEAFKVVIVNSLTNIVTHSKEASIIDFFIACKDLCDEGKTIFMVVHTYAFDEKMLIRVRSLCDATSN